jgi:hypothetical protein
MKPAVITIGASRPMQGVNRDDFQGLGPIPCRASHIQLDGIDVTGF